MINFPDNPTVNQVFTAGSQTWVYDGAKWVAYGVAQGIYLPLTGGKLTGALNPAGGVIGVADGSDAAPGFVGEVISSVGTLPGVSLTTTTNTVLISIALTPGDWDVYGDVWMTNSAGMTNCALSISTNTVNPTAPAVNTSRVQLTTAWGAGIFLITTRPVRASLAAQQTYNLVAYASFSSGTVTAAGVIWARRAR